MPSELTNEEFFRLIAFTRNLFTATSAAQYAIAADRVKDTDPSLIHLSSEVKTERELKHVLDDEDGDAFTVLRRLNSLKILRNDTDIQTFTNDVIHGYVAVVERGKMGLARA
jgi:hypothetical protein